MPTSTYTAIASVTLTANTAEVVFTGIPQSFRDLILVMTGGFTTSGDSMIRFNNDSAGNYSRVYALGDGSSAGGGANLTLVGGNWFNFAANLNNNGVLHVLDYAQDKHKTILSRWNTPLDGFAGMMAGRWASTAAVNQISIGVHAASVLSGSTITIYGVIA